jgi:hypothetical protein
MADPRPPGDQLEEIWRRIKSLEDEQRRFSGTQRVAGVDQIQRTVAYLESLRTYAANTAGLASTGTVANDAVTHWFATSVDTRIDDIECPTGRLTIEASCGEASLTPGGSFVQGLVSYSLRDVNNVVIPGAGIASRDGRLYTNQRVGSGITTYAVPVDIDREIYPGPYVARAFVGMWVAAANTTPCVATFNSVSLRVQIIGEATDYL